MTLLHDLRSAFNSLRRSPGFAFVAIITIALAVGANSSIFSIIDGVLLRPLPYPEPDRLVRLHHQAPQEGLTVIEGSFSPHDFEDLERATTSYENLAAFLVGDVPLISGGEPREVRGANVTGDYFQTIGLDAVVGRPLLPEDEEAAARFVVLGYELWQTRFGGDPGIVDRTVQLGRESFTVVGVMPAHADLPDPEVQLWMPISLIGEDDIPQTRDLRWMGVIGRLRPDVTQEQATAETNAVLTRLEQEYPESNTGWGRGSIQTVHESIVGQVRPTLLALLGTVAVVLLIACANLANLVVARGITRGRETAARVALGASRRHIVRQMLSESLVLGLTGGWLGYLLATQVVPVMIAMSDGTIPRPEEIYPDTRVALFTLLVALATVSLFSLVPALRTARRSAAGVLRSGGRGGTASRGIDRGRSMLIVAQSALAMILLAGTALMVRSLINLNRIDPGFAAQNVLTLGISMDAGSDFERESRFTERAQIMERIAALPGVVSVAGGKTLPLAGGGEPYAFEIPGRLAEPGGMQPEAGTFIVTSSYFRTLGIPLVSGRPFRDSDLSNPVTEVVISESMAERYWPGEDAVGTTISLGGGEFTVTGIAADVRTNGITTTPAPAMYVSSTLFGRSSHQLFVRTASDPMQLAGAVQAVVHEVTPQQPISGLTTLDRVVAEATARSRFLTTLLGVFGALALAMAALGVYGVTAFAVSQRTAEIGIRIALGATREAVLRLVAGKTMLLAAAGLVIGLPIGLALTGMLRGLLYDVAPSDPLALAAAAATILLVAFGATQIPARRATRVDPMVTLRTE